jgi:hypothetical protein
VEPRVVERASGVAGLPLRCGVGLGWVERMSAKKKIGGGGGGGFRTSLFESCEIVSGAGSGWCFELPRSDRLLLVPKPRDCCS